MEKREEFEIPADIAEWVGLKKSEYLSQLIMSLQVDDIGFEKFHEYDYLIAETVGQPDKTFENHADDYPIRTYTKTYSTDQTFHQVVLGMMYDDGGSSHIFIPILVFVSKFDELIKEFSQGHVISGPILN